MKNIPIDLDSLDYTKTISFYANFYNISFNTMVRKFKKLDVYKKFIFTNGHVSKIRSELYQKKYESNPRKCLNCDCKIPYNKRKNKYCSSQCAAIHTQKDGGHKHWSESDKKRLSDISKLNPSWRKNWYIKGERYNKICDNCQKEFSVTKCCVKMNCCCKNCKNQWMIKTGYLKGKSGGCRDGAGRGKSGWYKGYYCNSTYELAWVIYQIDNKIEFKRNVEAFDYIDSEGKLRKYYPDFYLEKEKQYVEIKGYKEKEFENKQKCFPHKISVIDKVLIKPFLAYAKKKYTTDLKTLYKNNPHNKKFEKCIICQKPAKKKCCSRVCSGKYVASFRKVLEGAEVGSSHGLENRSS